MIRRAICVFKRLKNGGRTAYSLIEGFKKHGISVEFIPSPDALPPPDDSTIAVAWGWKKGERAFAKGYQLLLIERGFIGDRFAWTSFGWNGLNGRAIFKEVNDGGERFKRYFPSLLKEWRRVRSSRKALIMGQVASDAAILSTGGNIHQWYDRAALRLRERDYAVSFRKHPLEKDLYLAPALRGSVLVNGSLAQALEDVDLVVTFNSNSGVDAALAGIPVVVCDDGAMAKPVAAFGLDAEPVRPPRETWAHRLAWKQFSDGEIQQGIAWEVARQAVQL